MFQFPFLALDKKRIEKLAYSRFSIVFIFVLNIVMKKGITIILLLFYFGLSAQNFIGNPNFEEINECEEYGSRCASEAWFRIPPHDLTITDKVKRIAHTGKVSEIIVLENTRHPLSRRVFLYTKLLCPLIKGNKYQLSFYLNPLKKEDYKVEALFSKEELIAGVKNPLAFKASLLFTIEEEIGKPDEDGWKKVQTSFIATGEETFLTLGYFSKKEIKATRKELSNHKGDIIVLIDDISLLPMDKTEQLCENAEAQKIDLYEQNHRHTNKISVDSIYNHIEEKVWTNNFFEKPEADSILEKEEIVDTSIPIIEDKEWNEKDTLVFEIPHVAFDFDRTKIKDEFQSKLDSFALQIQYLNPEKIEFIGHTDSMGSLDYNQQLSQRRAQAVQFYLNKFDYFKNLDFEIIGKGELLPKADNKTIEGRQLNRRVEIVIYKSKTN